MYDNGVIYIALDSKTPLLTAAGHEMFHYLKNTAFNQAQELQDFVIDKLKSDVNYNYDERFSNLAKTYGTEDADYINEEIAANAMFDVLAREENIRQLAQENKSLAKKVFSRIKEFIKAFKAAVGNIQQREAVVLRNQIDTLKEIYDKFDKALQELDRNKNAVYEGGEIKYSLDKYSDKQKENWKNSKRILLYEDDVQFRKFIDNSLSGEQLNKKIYFGAVSEGLSQVIQHSTGINVKGFNCSLSSNEIRKIFKDHGDSNKENLRGQRAVTTDDIILIPKIIQAPQKITLSPTLYNGKPVIHFVKDIGGRMTVSAVVSDKHLDLFVQTAFINIKKESLSTPIGEQAPINTLKASSGTAFNNSIPQNKSAVNSQYMQDSGKDTEKSSLKERDSEYLAAVNSGDTETAQKLVDEAAKNAGYTERLYHGSKNGGGFTRFKDWQYFTPDKEYAMRYTDNGSEDSLYGVYAKFENPFDTRISQIRDIYENEFYGVYSRTDLQESGLPDWTDGYDLVDFFEENDYDYDAILLDEGGDPTENGVKKRGISYVIKKSAQIKSADAVTYDDNGDVIPLSQRFDEGNADIRYSLQEEIDSYNLGSLNDYIGVQKRVLKQLDSENFFSDNGERVVYNKSFGNNIIINKSGIRETLGKGNRFETLPSKLKQLKLATIRQLPEIIENAVVYKAGEADYHKNNPDLSYSYLKSTVSIDGESYDIIVDIRESREKNKFWMHRIYEINKNEQPFGVAESKDSKTTLSKVTAHGDTLSQTELDVKGKFSLQEDQELTEAHAELLKENSKLAKANQILNEQLTLTNGHTMNKTAEEKIGRYIDRLLKENSIGGVKADEIKERIFSIFHYLSDDYADITSAFDAMLVVGEDIAKNAYVEMYDGLDDIREMVKELRKDIRSVKIHLNEEQYKHLVEEYGSLTNAKKAFYSGFNITKNPTTESMNIDVMWSELINKYAGLFSERDTELDSVHMLQRLNEVMQVVPKQYSSGRKISQFP